ncbi:MAG: hypothetical protein WBB39_04525 [Candidatus Saccharimonadales bacterium]
MQPQQQPTMSPQAKKTSTTPRLRNPNSTQNTLLVSEVRENMAIMNDGGFRAVVQCESINFDLMSQRERESVEYGYQGFLNSLYFPIQVLIRSQRVDIGPYLGRLSRIRRDQDNMLLGVLMDDYMAFIQALSQEANIMDKQFYVVVPYYPGGDVNTALNTSKNIFSSVLHPDKQTYIHIDRSTYDKGKEEIANRVGLVSNGLIQMGVRTKQLNTKELASLFYNSYNPDTAVRQPLKDYTDIEGSFVTQGEGSTPLPNSGEETD